MADSTKWKFQGEIPKIFGLIYNDWLLTVAKSIKVDF